MRITELIAELQRELEAHGDVEVEVAVEITESRNFSYTATSNGPHLSVGVDGGRVVLRGEADY